MKKTIKTISLGIALLCAALAGKAQVQTVNLSTGINNSTSALIPVNSADDTWTVKVPGGSTYISALCSTGAPSGYPPYSGIDASVRMISPYLTGAGDLINTALAGNYTYKMTFDYAGGCTNSASIYLNSVGGDNTVTNLYVNGTAHAINKGFSPWGSGITLTLATSEIIAGTNTITVTLNNEGSYTGFTMRGALTINYTSPVLTPSFSTSSIICSGSLITADGSASTGTIADYVWTVWECDQYGTVNTAVSEWWSPFYTGAPGSITFPNATSGGPTLTCGKYYKVKLALQNSCNPWAETAQIIYMACPPVVSTRGSTATVCSGSEASLVAGITTVPGHDYTMTWTYVAGFFHHIPLIATVYSGPPAGVVVTPTVTTTYTCVVTDNTTGCSTTVTWTVTVVNNDPSFSLTVNTANPSYFTVIANANDLTASSVSGFTYSLVVEELNTSTLASYYSNTGTDAWWDFPSHQFRGYVSTGTGTYTQTPWWSGTPAIGQFLYNHTYRITRGTWNDYCSYKQFSQTITPVKSLNGSTSMVIADDNNAPDFSYLANYRQEQAPVLADDQMSIYPNPGTGVFTIELTSDSKTSVEVYDVLGKKVKSFEQNAFKSTLDLTGYPKGIYMVKISAENKIISKKIILE